MLRFPHAVLQAFLRSFPLVNKLAHQSETEVFEEYLRMRWMEGCPLPDKTPPTGEEGIAQLRLLCQAQGNASHVLKAFHKLGDEDKKLLSLEMCRTGCAGQQYMAAPQSEAAGPAILMYYGPALMQKKVSSERDVICALKSMCEVYRKARALWPASAARQNENVTVRIDTIKGLKPDQVIEAMGQGEVFLLVKHNDREAFIERHPLDKINDLNEGHMPYVTVCLITSKDNSD